MSKKVKNIILAVLATLGIFTMVQYVGNNEFITTYGYVNFEDENEKINDAISDNSDSDEQSLENFIQVHQTPFSKTVIKDDD